MTGTALATAPPAADEKHSTPPGPTPICQGLLIFDWDDTIIDKENRLISGARTKALLSLALKNKIDIFIVTARPNIQATLNSLLTKLNQLGLVNETHNEAFWRQRIYCVTTEEERLQLKNQSNASIANKKKDCIESILARIEHMHLKKSQVFFYDDNLLNCHVVHTLNKVTVVHAKPNGSHFHTYPSTLQLNQELMDKQNLRDYLQKINNCLNAMYPDRTQWKDHPKTNAGGVKELHKVLIKYAANPDSFGLQGLTDIYDITTRRLQKYCVECLPTFFGGRDPFVQQLYLALDYYPRLGSLELINKELDDLLLRIQARNALKQAAATPAAQITLAVR